MQRRMLSLLAVCCTAVAGIAAAQTPSARFGLGGGVIIPVGNYKDADKIGWHGLGMGQFVLPGSPVDICVDTGYRRASPKPNSTLHVFSAYYLYTRRAS